MYKPLLFLFLLGFSSFTQAQKLQLIDKEDLTPIQGVVIHNEDKSKSGITDFDGFVDISIFNNTEVLFFSHVSYAILSIEKRNILNNIIKLSYSANALEEIILSVSKFAQSKRKVPQQISSITNEDILLTNPQTSADVLERSGNVYVQKSQLGGGSPLIRGFSTNRLLITVDGVRFNTAIYRGGNVQNVISIDPLSLNNTEVILGPGSVIYGSDAIGGVMNFYTKKPSFSSKNGKTFKANILGRYASANKEKTGHLDFNIGGKKWAFLTSVSYSDFSDLKMGSHGPEDYLRPYYVETINGEDILVENKDSKIQKFTGYNQINFMQKVRFLPSKEWDFNLGLFYTTTSDYPRYDRLIRPKDNGLRSAEWYYDPQVWISGNLQIDFKPENTKLFTESKAGLSYQQFKEGRNDRDFGDNILYQTNEVVHAYTTNFDFIKKINKLNLYYGLEYILNRVNSKGLQTNVNTNNSTQNVSRYPDGSKWQSIAGYFSLQTKLYENFTFQGGIRYNRVLINADFRSNNAFYNLPFEEANINTGALTASAGIIWQASKMLSLRTNVGTAFRAPNIDDVGKVFDSEPGSVVVPNPDVKPEYAYNTEIGAVLNFSDIVKIDLATYYTILEDALIRRDFNLNGQTQIDYQGELSDIQAIQNAGEARIYGFEVGLEVNLSKYIQLISQYNISRGYTREDNGTKLPVRHIAPPFGKTKLLFKKGKTRLEGFLNYNGSFSFEDLAPSQQNNAFLYAKDENGNPYSPSWYTLNFAASYQLFSDLDLSLVVENISDQRYRTYSSGIASPGRNIVLGINYKI